MNVNISKLVTRIKLKIGIYGVALPIENLDEIITDIIKDITLPVFSTYCPYEEKLYIDLDKLERLEHTSSYSSYLLPEFNQRKLLYIKDISYDDRCLSGIGYWGGDVPYLNGVLLQQTMISNAANNLLRMALPKLNFQFEPPRRVYIYNMIATNSLIFSLMFEHDKNLQTITPTQEESFYKLAVLDVKDNLYGLVKHYNQIQTAYGTIDLKIDDWQNADAERKDLLADWDERYQLDLGQITWS